MILGNLRRRSTPRKTRPMIETLCASAGCQRLSVLRPRRRRPSSAMSRANMSPSRRSTSPASRRESVRRGDALKAGDPIAHGRDRRRRDRAAQRRGRAGADAVRSRQHPVRPPARGDRRAGSEPEGRQGQTDDDAAHVPARAEPAWSAATPPRPIDTRPDRLRRRRRPRATSSPPISPSPSCPPATTRSPPPRAKVEQAPPRATPREWRLSQRSLVAPAPAMSPTSCAASATSPARTAPVVSFLPDGAIKLKVYVPEAGLAA